MNFVLSVYRKEKNRKFNQTKSSRISIISFTYMITKFNVYFTALPAGYIRIEMKEKFKFMIMKEMNKFIIQI